MFNLDVVTDHVRQASEAMRWGVDDCCMFVRNIVLDCGGPDLMAGVRKYHNEKEAKVLLARKGGVLRMVMAQADRLRAIEVHHPFPDDKMLVGIVPTQHGPALSLRVNGRWVVRSQFGVAVHEDAMCVIAWEIPNA